MVRYCHYVPKNLQSHGYFASMEYFGRFIWRFSLLEGTRRVWDGLLCPLTTVALTEGNEEDEDGGGCG